MQQRYLLVCFFLLTVFSLSAQSGCPGCLVSVPAGLPADTLYLPLLPDGLQGSAYNQDISFRMPKTTTPVAAVDSTTPPGLTISSIEILAVDGLPPGLHWQPNQFVFQVADQTDGCIKICGTPTVSDSFVLTVHVKATVFVISKEATFPMRLYIAPKISTTDGFSMTNYTGCDSTTVSFTNNIPSGGNPGFHYLWDFGDSTTFAGENPAPHTYTAPGVYPVNYQVIIDTSGYTLESITVVDVDCVDQLGVGAPDLYLLVDDPSGTRVFDSSPDVNNTPLPYNFPVGLVLGSGNYTLSVVDEDSGPKGGDDDCGTLSFNILSNGTLVAGGLTVILNIVHPIDTLTATDTVTVYPLPVLPVYDVYKNRLRLIDTVQLPAMYSLQWYQDNHPIPGATGFTYCTEIEGFYGLLITDLTTGCSNYYATAVLTDPNFDCTTGIGELMPLQFGVLPNPATDAALVRLGQPLSEAGLLRAWDAAGRLISTQPVSAGAADIPVDCAGWPNGLFVLELRSGGSRGLARLVLVK
ncbi:MAG: PKD domain-containing protein [Saprospiraceae bacterium]